MMFFVNDKLCNNYRHSYSFCVTIYSINKVKINLITQKSCNKTTNIYFIDNYYVTYFLIAILNSYIQYIFT